MGSTCLQIPISQNDINLQDCYQQKIFEPNQNFEASEKSSQQSQCSDEEIQQTSHSDEDDSSEYLETRLKMINQSPSKPTKSILKKQSQCAILRQTIKIKTVSFCFTDPNILKQMLNHSGKLSKAQEEFLQSLYASE